MAYGLASLFKRVGRDFSALDPRRQTGLFASRNPRQSLLNQSIAPPAVPRMDASFDLFSPGVQARPRTKTQHSPLFQGPMPAGTTPEQEALFRQTGQEPPRAAAPPIPVRFAAATPPPPAPGAGVQYQDLAMRGNAVVNKATGEEYSSPEHLAAAMGIAPHQIQWQNILPETAAPEGGPTAPTAMYDRFVEGLDGAIYKLNEDGNIEREISSNEELAQELGIQPHEIDWERIKGERELFGAQVEEGGPDVPDTGEEADMELPDLEASPETQAALAAAEKAYQESIQIGPGELSTQADIDRLIESTKTAFLNTQQQTVPMEFITGQLRAIEQRALNLAEPLERKLARLQAQRQSATAASGFALERAEAKLAREEGREQQMFDNIMSQRQFGEQQKQNAWARAYDERTFEEDKRRFGLQYAMEQKRFAREVLESDRDYQFARNQFNEDMRRFDMEHMLSREKFEEDKRQFGENVAIAQREIAVKAFEAQAEAQLAAGNPEGIKTSLDLVQSSLAMAGQLAHAAGRSGIRRGFEATFVGDTDFTNLRTQIDTVKTNMLTLVGDANVRKFFGPQMSEADVRMMTASATTLNAEDQNPEVLRAELKRIQGIITRLQDAYSASAGGESFLSPDTGHNYNFSSGGGGTPTAQGMRTDRHNNPTAFTTDVAKQAELVEGRDYTRGDPFPNNPNAFTAKLLGNPVDITRRVIDKIGFHTASGKQRWSHTAIPHTQWKKMSTREKNKTIASMYQREGNKGALSKYFS